MLELNKIYNEDCLDAMKRIDDASIDLILCDLPYAITDCKWDTIIPFNKLWESYERIIKHNGAICLFGVEPFSSYLRMSNIKIYRYDWYWIKNIVTGFVNAKNKPMRNLELISVFSKAANGHAINNNKNRMNYNPQDLIEINKKVKSNPRKGGTIIGYIKPHGETYLQQYTNYPKQTLNFNGESGLHPTQKPVALFEYLIKTYTTEKQIVLDNCAGSCTTAVAAQNTNRNWICIEKEKNYCEIGESRLIKNKCNIV